MTNQNQSVSSLTVAELDSIISDIVRRVVREELHQSPAPKSDALLETFGSWIDTRTPEEIVTEIYDSRSLSASDVSL
jgi:hypothetical protein